MNITENCLTYLSEKKWLELNAILSDEKKCKELASDPIFSIFENNLVSEIKRFENENDENLITVLVRIFQLNKDLKILKLSNNCTIQISEYLFEKYPSEKYAKNLPNNKVAKEFLENITEKRNIKIEKTKLASNLNIKVGATGELDFSKSIFNSPQEKELFLAAKQVIKGQIIFPNIALSTIINSKIVDLLDKKTASFFFKSTLDLCIIDMITYKPTFFVELDSSWHDKPKNIEKDKMKDEIFKTAGYKLHRLRKLKNKSMEEVFEIYIKNNYAS